MAVELFSSSYSSTFPLGNSVMEIAILGNLQCHAQDLSRYLDRVVAGEMTAKLFFVTTKSLTAIFTPLFRVGSKR
jgi:hypothetical protein